MVVTKQVRSLLQLADALKKLPAVFRGKATEGEIEELYEILTDYDFYVEQDELREQKNTKEALHKILSQEVTNKQILSQANKELKDEGLNPVGKLTGYDILEIAKELRRKTFCVQKCGPENCPFKGLVYHLIHTPVGIFAVERFCTPYYRYMLRKEIGELAGRRISQIHDKYGSLEDLDVKTLKEIKEVLNRSRRREE